MTDSNVTSLVNSPTAHFENVTSVDVADVVSYLLVRKWTILAIAAVVFAIAAIKAYTVEPVYQARALIQIEQNKMQGAGGVNIMKNLLGGGGGESSSSETIILKSNHIFGTAVDELGLANSAGPVYFPVIGSTIARQYEGDELAEPLFGLSSYAWGGEVIRLDRLDISGELAEDISQWELIAGENGEYTLYYYGRDEPVLTGKVGEAAVAELTEYENSKIELFVSQLISRPGQIFMLSHTPRIAIIEGLQNTVGVSEMGEGTGMISLILEGSNKRSIVNILKEIANVYVRNNVEQHSEEAQNTLDFIESQLPSLKEKLDTAAVELQQYRQDVGSVNMKLETTMSVQKLSKYDEELSKLQLKHEELALNFTEKHPKLRVISRQIETLQEKRQKIESELHDLPEKEIDYIEKEREVKVAKTLYEELLNKSQQIKITKAGTVGNVRIIDPPEVAFRPINEGKTMKLILGAVLGLMLGIAWVLMKKMLHKGVEDPTLIESTTGHSVIATIPHSDDETSIFSGITSRKKERAKKVRLLAYEKEGDLAVEALRSFRTSMRFSMKAAENNVMLISGPAPSIGKSFFSANYAAVSAIEGQRVLLIDADMRRGHLQQYMGTEMTPGLAELIMDECPVDKAVHEVSENLFFISAGEKIARPAELLASDNFRNLLLQLQQGYDLVIIDTPPILAVTDAGIIAQYGGQLFVLLRSGQHKMSEIQAAISRFEKNGVKIAGLLMNDADMSKDTSGHIYQYEYK